jgi:hypothetical protein
MSAQQIPSTSLVSTQSGHNSRTLPPEVCSQTFPNYKEIPMKSIRKVVYAALLALSALNFAPTPASAQDEGGRFTLPHEVRWQNVVVPAGEYRFALQPMGPSEMLKLTKITGSPASFMLVANDTEAGTSSSTARLLINSEGERSYASAMELPQFEVTLHFAAPVKALAVVRTASSAGSAR